MVDLSGILSIDLNIIEEEVTDLCKRQAALRLVQGQIISRDYEVSLAEQVNERLLREGCVTLDDLSSEFELPGDFIRKARVK